jgi:hypothetical protein
VAALRCPDVLVAGAADGEGALARHKLAAQHVQPHRLVAHRTRRAPGAGAGLQRRERQEKAVGSGIARRRWGCRHKHLNEWPSAAIFICRLPPRPQGCLC